MNKILVRAPNWLGDVIMSTPFLKKLRQQNPGSRIHVLARPGFREIFDGMPGIEKAVFFEQGENMLALTRRLKSESYDAAYILPPSFSSALLFFLAGIPNRTGYATDFRRLLLNTALPLDERYHYVRRYLALLGESGIEVGPDDFYFPKPKYAVEGAKRFMQSQGIVEKSPILAVAPGSQAPARRWFPERFAELINRLPEQDYPTVFLLGAPSDVPICREVEDLCERPVINLCGQTSLLVLGDLLRHCAALVTNESGMMHVGWAVGTPLVVMAGPSDPQLTSPFGAGVRILQHREVPCVPCVKNECFRPPDVYKECLRKIDVNEVEEALSGLVAVNQRR